MIDDTPQVRWSNAWWRLALFGYVLPLSLVGLAIHCMLAEKAFTAGGFGRHGFRIYEVHGFQFHLMIIVYFCLALASFAYGRGKSEAILATSLAGAAICVVWCSLLFVM